jgi:anti-sigma factor RsiW
MNCKSCQNEFADHLFGAETPEEKTAMAEHLAGCKSCGEEFAGLQKTMDLMDGWRAPGPSAYFDQKMAVLLREEQAKSPAGWLERMRERLLFNTGRQFRPALAGALALMLVLGGGGFIGVSSLNHPVQPQVSATVNDLQILDKNDQAIQQMDQLLQDDDSKDSNTAAQPAS